MGKHLLIVESPAKAKTIQQYLGQGWDVTASVGHIRDLPVSSMGVEPPDHRPDYEVLENKQKTVRWIQKLAQTADAVWLATDDDREGEAIAWHLQQVIGKHNYHRVRFNEITQSSIRKAVQNPGQLDYKKFLAQQGRRVIDRYAGYLVSNALKVRTQSIRTAGRVQTPALRMIVEREIEVEQFVPTTHYGVIAATLHKSEFVWKAEWNTKPFTTEENPLVTDQTIPAAIAATVTSATVSDMTEGKTSRNPPPPLTTSTLQQAASIRLGLDSKSTMNAAQKLYEAGLITYHRTDNPNLSDEAVEALRAYLVNAGLETYIQEPKRTWKAKDGAQEAHEAIRPTDFALKDVDTGDSNQNAVYHLIWSAAVGCQMTAAVYATTQIVMTADQAVPGVTLPVDFIAKGRRLIYDGWLRLLGDDPTDEETGKEKDQQLPKVEKDERVMFEAVSLLTKSTKPPPRFTPARLVKELERRGVGRPSTYADIQNGLLKRQYVTLKQKKYQPTVLGRALIEIVSDQFCFADIEFTNQLEARLDALANGQASYEQLVDEFYTTLNLEIQAFMGMELELPNLTAANDEATHNCPKCDGQLNRISGSNGFFWGCSNYKQGCTYKAPDQRGKPQAYYECPSCGQGNLRRIKGNRGFFWGCSNYKQGCNAMFDDKRGKPQLNNT